MSEVRLADALARLQEYKELHLPLRRGDLLGRLALRFLWRRQLKWQVENNIAVRDAVSALQDIWREERARIDRAADKDGLATTEQLRHELDALRRSDQNMMAGLNQRLYSAVGRVQTQVSDLRLELGAKAEASDELELRLKALEEQVAALTSAAHGARTRYAQLDLFLDRARAARAGTPGASETGTPETGTADAAAVPDRNSFIELAVAELLDGPAEHVRAARESFLPVVRAARADGAAGPVLDVAPGRGEWLEVLRAAEVPYRAVSANPLVRERCAGAGCQVPAGDPLALLADAPNRSLGAVTAFRYVERLEPAALARFVDLAAAAVQPGGVFVVETPVAGPDFHLDPFALRPVHQDFLRLLVEAAGFARVEVRDAAAAGTDRYRLLAWR